MFDAFSPGDYPSDSPRSAFKPVAGRMRLFKKDEAAPDPAIGQATMRQIALAEQHWAEYTKEGGDRDWLKGVTEEALGIQRQNADKAGALSDYQLDSMRRNDERYWNTAVPFEDQLLEDVKRFDSDGYKQNLVDTAVADVNAQGANARDQASRGLTRMGVNPMSGAFSNLANATSVAQASAAASAANKTRMAADQIGLSTKMSMYGGMKGLAGLGNANASLATGALGTGLNAAGGMSGAASSNIGTNNSTFNSAMGGMTSGISGANANSANAINASKAANDDGGAMGAIGTIGGAAITVF